MEDSDFSKCKVILLDVPQALKDATKEYLIPLEWPYGSPPGYTAQPKAYPHPKLKITLVESNPSRTMQWAREWADTIADLKQPEIWPAYGDSTSGFGLELLCVRPLRSGHGTVIVTRRYGKFPPEFFKEK